MFRVFAADTGSAVSLGVKQCINGSREGDTKIIQLVGDANHNIFFQSGTISLRIRVLTSLKMYTVQPAF